MTGHRALEKKQITQGNNRKVQNPGGSPRKATLQWSGFFVYSPYHIVYGGSVVNYGAI